MRHKWSIFIFSVGVLFVIASFFIFSKDRLFIPSKTGVQIIDGNADTLSNDQTQIYVEVSGSVNNPGLFSFNNGDRVDDALKKAGGLSVDANTEFVAKNLNKAAKLTDGQKIYIPSKSETVLSAKSNLININESSSKELESLPGIGEVTAKKIIDNRPYSEISDLVNKKIVSSKVYEQIKETISVY